MHASPTVTVLSSYDWARLPAPVLTRLGLDPDHRLHYTGHTSMIPAAWVPSIGKWCLTSTRAFLSGTEAAEPILKNMRANTFEVFRHRWGLMARRHFERAHGPLRGRPWLLAERAWRAVRRLEQESLLPGGMVSPSIGKLSREAQDRGRYSSTRTDPIGQLGMLPIEIVIWAKIFVGFLDTIHAFAEWEILEDEDKRAIWGDRNAQFETVLHAPAALFLPTPGSVASVAA